ncbi:MAG: hypothetical protein AABX74_01585 [Nanoarchaeota archaeon]
MVNSVLSTIDTELDEEFYVSRGGFSRRLFNFMRDLSLRLNELGVSFEVYRPSSTERETEREKLEERIAGSDIIFHSKGAMLEVPVPEPRFDVNFVDEIIRHHIQKSHTFEARDKYQMSKAMEAAGVPIPKTMTIEEYLDSKRELPVVLKERRSTLGKGVYFINRDGLVERFFKEDKYSKTPGRTPRKKRYFVQQFIHTPGLFLSHYRIFTVGEEILGCVLSYTPVYKKALDEASKNKTIDELFYTLRLRSIATNDGIEIPLSHQPTSEVSTARSSVLRHRGIDPENVAIPQPLRELAQLAGRELRKCGFAYAGQDYVREGQSRFYFLEVNTFPNLDTFNTLFFDGKGSPADYRALAIGKIAEAIARYNPPNLVR